MEMSIGNKRLNRKCHLFTDTLTSIMSFINFSYAFFLIFSFVSAVGSSLLNFDIFSGNEIFSSLITMSLITTVIIIGNIALCKNNKVLLTSFVFLFLSINGNYILHLKQYTNQYEFYRYLLFISLFSINALMLGLHFSLVYLQKFGYIRFNLDDLNINLLIKEIQFRIDLLKINFNNFAINCKLHKITPFLLFKKESYSFLTEEVEEEQEECSQEKASYMNSGDFHTISTIDTEYESLN